MMGDATFVASSSTEVAPKVAKGNESLTAGIQMGLEAAKKKHSIESSDDSISKSLTPTSISEANATGMAGAILIKRLSQSGENVEKKSIDVLKETQELADITTVQNVITPTAPTIDIEKSNTSHKENVGEGVLKGKTIEMVFENSIDEKSSSETPLGNTAHSNASDRTDASMDAAQGLRATMQSSQSGRMNKLRDHSSSIFPAGIMACGVNSEKVTNSNLNTTPNSTPSIGGNNPNSRRPSTTSGAINAGGSAALLSNDLTSPSRMGRNPLTGGGIQADETIKKTASARRKDGNPLLGEGYDNKILSTSTTRIPPGGYSQGLW